MPRKSQPKLIVNRPKYTQLLSKYREMLELLDSRHRVVRNPRFSELVNFKTNKNVPRHRWFDYKQGYSAKLVESVLEKEAPSKNCYVLDPFTGVGTTNVVAQALGYKSIGFDINPVATFAANVKTAYYSDDEKREVEQLIQSFIPKIPTSTPNSPLLRRSFSERMFDQLMSIKGFYEDIENLKIQSLLKLAYISIVEVCSNRVKDGNGIKIVRNKQEILDAYSYYIERLKLMLKDIEEVNPMSEATIITGSVLRDEDFNLVKDKEVGLVIFSPPYANCFDYCEVYKLELWMGEFVSSYEDFRKYRSMAIRSHVNSKFDHTIKNPNASVDLISDLISCFNIWNRNIPDMIRGYFDDMAELFRRLYKVMIPNSKCFIVVANSGYKGIIVPTDLLLAEIAGVVGLKCKEIRYARKIRASSQQMTDLQEKYERLMRESILIIEKT